jgi:hypothetical protein
MAFGTLTSFDTLATADNTTVAEFGEDNAWQAIQEALTAHNQQLAESLQMFVTDTTDRHRRYGGADSMEMEELDEFGTPDAQKIAAGATVAFPMRFYGVGVQWTRLYFQNIMASEFAAQIVARQDADVRNIQKQLKRALLLSSNYTSIDRRTDKVSLSIKRLANADGAAIPTAPDGSNFDGSTHTHYLGATAAWSGATNTQVATDIKAIANTVLEHFLSGQILVLINRAQEDKVKAADGFAAYVDSRIIQAPGGTTQFARGNLDVSNPTNRAIGILGPAEIWVKPWIPAGYIVAVHVGGTEKALVRRIRRMGGGQLELLFDNEQYPLRAQAVGREFGFGVWNRVAAAALYTGGTSYTDPTIS